MSYREENGQVVLTMSREDYDNLLFRLGLAAGDRVFRQGCSLEDEFALLNRINEGNPHFVPYDLAKNKTGGA